MSALTDTFTAIANAIRTKLGVSTTYTPAQMASAIASIPKAILQSKSTNVTPSANWSGTNTNYATVTPDSGYDGMSQLQVSVPMLRDNTLMEADSISSPSTVYNGNTSQSNSQQLLRMHPTKDGMSYTGSYLFLKPNSYLGNATASDVLSGKTFSSSNGIQITGTGSGGTTPTGTKYDTYSSNGTYTTDVSSYANHSVTVAVDQQYGNYLVGIGSNVPYNNLQCIWTKITGVVLWRVDSYTITVPHSTPYVEIYDETVSETSVYVYKGSTRSQVEMSSGNTILWSINQDYSSGSRLDGVLSLRGQSTIAYNVYLIPYVKRPV